MTLLAYQLLSSPAFRVTRVEVTGQNLLTYGEVVQAAGVLGQNVFSLDRRAVAEAVNTLGTLKSVEVSVALPNAVKITLVEHEPRFVWQAGANSFLVDERGVVLAEGGRQANLPAVREVTGAARKRGDRVNLAALQASAQLAAVWPARLGKPPACEYDQTGLTLAGDKWRAELGDGSDLEAKVMALAAVLDYAKAEGKPLSRVDLRLPERPYFK